MRLLRNKRNQLRTIWRMVIYLLLGVIVFLPFIPILKILPLEAGQDQFESVVNLVFVLFLNVSFVLAGWIMYKWIDRRPPAMLGFNFWPSGCKELLIGMGVGFCNCGLVILVLLACGWISVTWSGSTSADWGTYLFYVATYLVFASIEEVINRGYLFQAFSEGAGIPIAAVTVSLIFSIVHVFNPAFSILAGIFLFVHALLYTVAYLKTRSLWTPIGLHMAWNFTQGPVAGMKVSGTSVESSLFLTEVGGPDVLTGSTFGVEGGLIAIIISIIILLLLLKARWLKPSRRFLQRERKWKAEAGVEVQESLTPTSAGGTQ